MELSEQELGRRQALAALRELGIDPYPAAEFPVNAYSDEIRASFVDLPTTTDEEGNEVPGVATPENSRQVIVAGRMMSRRVMGKASFSELMDSRGRIQIYVQRDAICPDEDKTLYNVV